MTRRVESGKSDEVAASPAFMQLDRSRERDELLPCVCTCGAPLIRLPRQASCVCTGCGSLTYRFDAPEEDCPSETDQQLRKNEAQVLERFMEELQPFRPISTPAAFAARDIERIRVHLRERRIRPDAWMSYLTVSRMESVLRELNMPHLIAHKWQLVTLFTGKKWPVISDATEEAVATLFMRARRCFAQNKQELGRKYFVNMTQFLCDVFRVVGVMAPLESLEGLDSNVRLTDQFRTTRELLWRVDPNLILD